MYNWYNDVRQWFSIKKNIRILTIWTIITKKKKEKIWFSIYYELQYYYCLFLLLIVFSENNMEYLILIYLKYWELKHYYINYFECITTSYDQIHVGCVNI